MEAERQRLFFALWPDAAQRAALARLAARLPDGLGRRVPPTNLHVTLLFLGSLAPAQRQAMEAVAAAVVAPACTVTLDRYGYWRRPQVLWVGSRVTPPALLVLVERLQQGAEAAGLRIDTRPYEVHLTLFRKVRRVPRAWPEPEPLVWPVDRYALVESVADAGGVRYEPLRSWALAGNAGSTSQ